MSSGSLLLARVLSRVSSGYCAEIGRILTVSMEAALCSLLAIWAEFRRCHVVIVQWKATALGGDSQYDEDFGRREGSGVEAFLPCDLFCRLP